MKHRIPWEPNRGTWPVSGGTMENMSLGILYWCWNLRSALSRTGTCWRKGNRSWLRVEGRFWGQLDVCHMGHLLDKLIWTHIRYLNLNVKKVKKKKKVPGSGGWNSHLENLPQKSQRPWLPCWKEIVPMAFVVKNHSVVSLGPTDFMKVLVGGGLTFDKARALSYHRGKWSNHR